MHPSSPDPVRPPGIALACEPWRGRTRHLLFATLGASLLSIGQVTAQEARETAPAEPATPPAGQTASTKPGRNGRICQFEEVTGSRMKKRVCHTPEQWEARERMSRDLVRDMDRRAIGEKAEPGG